MFFRCPECAARSSAKLWLPDAGTAVACSGCAKSFATRDVSKLGTTPGEHRAKADELAAACGIDSTSAYSVLIGILSVKRAREIADGIAQHGESPRTRDRAGESPAPTDPKVADRTAERRSPATREPEAAAEAHPSARKRRAATEERRVELPVASGKSPERKRRLWPVFAVAATLVVAVFGLATKGVLDASTPVLRTTPRLLRSVQLTTDAAGRVTEIVASDASSALLSLLEIDPSMTIYDPVEIVLLPQSDLRLGVMQHRNDPTARYAVEIRRVEDGAQHWCIGDGAEHVRPHKLDAVPDGMPTIPVVREAGRR